MNKGPNFYSVKYVCFVFVEIAVLAFCGPVVSWTFFIIGSANSVAPIRLACMTRRQLSQYAEIEAQLVFWFRNVNFYDKECDIVSIIQYVQRSLS